MANFDLIVEQHIRKAQLEGAFDNLPGEGKPLVFEDDSDVPPESRMAYRILKNAGYIPEELQLRKDIASLKELLEETPLEQVDKRKKLLGEINSNYARYYAILEKAQRGRLS